MLGLGFWALDVGWRSKGSGLRVFFFMGSFPTAVQQEFLYQEEPVVGLRV